MTETNPPAEGSSIGPWGTAGAGPPGPRLDRTDFIAAQAANRRGTWVLILLLFAIAAALGYAIGWSVQTFGEGVPVAAISPGGVLGAGAMLAVGLISTGVTFMAGEKVVTGLAGATQVGAEAEPQLHNVVEEMAIAAGLPKPKVVVIESEALNAFATGMTPERGVVGVTRGLLKTLNREELQGVIGHEMGHIANLDTRYMTAVGIMVGLIALVADMVLRGGMRAGARSSGGGKGKGGGAAIVLIVLLVAVILAPLAAQLVRFAVSRQREYLADATAVRFTRNPLGLIGALRKLDGATEPLKANRALQHLFIVNPLKKFGAKANAAFATHPAIEKRIQRLTNLGTI